MPITLEQMNEFCTVVRLQNFTKTAELLFMSQPTLSRHISLMEEYLGVQLLIRDNRTFAVTEAGRRLFECADDILRRAAEMERQVRQTAYDRQGRLTVAIDNIVFDPLFLAFQQFHAANPEILMSVAYQESREAMKNVLEGRLDACIAFSYDLPSEYEKLDGVSLIHDDFCVIVPNGHPLAGQTRVRMEQLRGERIIYMKRIDYEITRQMVACYADTLPSAADCSVPDVESLIIQIKSGAGISLLPRQVALPHSTGCRLLDIEDFDAGYDIVLIWRNDNPSVPLRGFRQMLSAVLGSE